MTVALVTGATKNIGFATAVALAKRGMTVAINGRDPKLVQDAVERLESQGAAAVGAVGDVSSETGVSLMIEQLSERVGSVDVLVNNAAVRAHGSLADLSVDDWQTVVDTVLTGSFLTTRAVLPGMVERNWGRIVNIAGVSGQSGASGRAPVVAAKAGIIGLTKATAHEGAPHGITANAVSPGHIDTDRSRTLGDDAVAAAHYEQMAAKVPLGRQGTPLDVAALCAYLCTEDAGFVTGQVLGVNGGVYM
jgi:NAD(P)-dependent dehydrogenase (short-subunit alcohol dehydrogenase family)